MFLDLDLTIAIARGDLKKKKKWGIDKIRYGTVL